MAAGRDEGRRRSVSSACSPSGHHPYPLPPDSLGARKAPPLQFSKDGQFLEWAPFVSEPRGYDSYVLKAGEALFRERGAMEQEACGCGEQETCAHFTEVDGHSRSPAQCQDPDWKQKQKEPSDSGALFLVTDSCSTLSRGQCSTRGVREERDPRGPFRQPL